MTEQTALRNIVTFACEYIVVNSGYTARLLEGEMLQRLSQFCARNGVIPLYIRDSVWGDGQIRRFRVQNGVLVPGILTTIPDVTHDFLQLRLANNELDNDGVIVFRVGNFQNAVNVFTNIISLDYCNWGSLTDMKFLRNGDGQIYLVYTEFDNDDNE